MDITDPFFNSISGFYFPILSWVGQAFQDSGYTNPEQIRGCCFLLQNESDYIKLTSKKCKIYKSTYKAKKRKCPYKDCKEVSQKGDAGKT